MKTSGVSEPWHENYFVKHLCVMLPIYQPVYSQLRAFGGVFFKIMKQCLYQVTISMAVKWSQKQNCQKLSSHTATWSWLQNRTISIRPYIRNVQLHSGKKHVYSLVQCASYMVLVSICPFMTPVQCLIFFKLTCSNYLSNQVSSSPSQLHSNEKRINVIPS